MYHKTEFIIRLILWNVKLENYVNPISYKIVANKEKKNKKFKILYTFCVYMTCDTNLTWR